MGAPTFDLQSHSTASDGSLPPGAVVAAAAQAGVQLLALTDHDTVDGVDEALEAGAAQGIRVVPAAELSALDVDGQDFHVLGYGFDHHHPALCEALVAWSADRAARAQQMADALRAHGLELEVPDRATIGRPHIARAAFEHPANRMRLAREEIVNSSQLLEAYLVPGASAFVPRTTPTIPEAIAAIHAAGGVAVWAHPFWDLESPGEVRATLDRLADDGLDGVEAFYVTHTAEQTALLVAHADERGLLTTGSADFHGPDHEHFDRFRAFDLYGLSPRLGAIG